MGTSFSSIATIGFEDVQHAIIYPEKYTIISTMPITATYTGLIRGTIPIDQEETAINRALSTGKTTTMCILIYGKNTTDESVVKRYNQLHNLGFSNLYVYLGGMFEWLALQDIYGTETFPTTNTHRIDMLAYKPVRRIAH